MTNIGPASSDSFCIVVGLSDDGPIAGPVSSRLSGVGSTLFGLDGPSAKGDEETSGGCKSEPERGVEGSKFSRDFSWEPSDLSRLVELDGFASDVLCEGI